jgi:hypothetical protein
LSLSRPVFTNRSGRLCLDRRLLVLPFLPISLPTFRSNRSLMAFTLRTADEPSASVGSL